jgi:MFS family permease
MVFNFLKADITISFRKFTSVTLLTSGTLAWFFLINLYHGDILRNIDPTNTWIVEGQIIFYGAAFFSGLLGSLIRKKGNLRTFLISWVIFGLISAILPLSFQGLEALIVISILMGFSLGFGLPASLALIANCTNIEERGRVSGATILEIFIIAFLTIAIIRLLGEEIVTIILLMTLVRSISFFALLLEKCDNDEKKKRTEVKRSNYKEFIFYIIPWVLFTFTAGLASNVIPDTDPYASVEHLVEPIRYGLIGIFGLIWGIIADRFGRKWPIYTGLIILGVSFALLGFAMSPDVTYIYWLLSGVAWGSFLSIYLIIPGDLSTVASREKYYALGTVSPILVLFSVTFIGGIATDFTAPAFTQILSILLFLSIIPIIRAKETLQESKIRKRKMKEYTNKLGKIIQESKEET